LSLLRLKSLDFGFILLKIRLKELYKGIFTGNLPRLFEKRKEY